MVNSLNQKKAIFIGGTGRSGTTILSKYLGTHSDIYQIPFESKFITEKYGTLDLYTALTKNFNTVQGNIAIAQFISLMRNAMCDPFVAPYIGYNLKKNVTSDYFNKCFSQLINSISYGKWYGWDKHTKDRYTNVFKLFRIMVAVLEKIAIYPVNKIISKKHQITFINSKRIRTRDWMYLPKYFNEKKELELILGIFVKALFFQMSKLNGKIHFCETTPSNMLHIDFISSIIPDGYFLHVTRNPIGVAFSLSQKNRLWAPNNINDVVNYLIPIYEKLIEMDQFSKNNGVKYKRVKLEDCSNAKVLFEINQFLGVNNSYDGTVKFVSNKVDYWEEKFPTKMINNYKNKLSKYITYFGY